jgi:hypothetical protein
VWREVGFYDDQRLVWFAEGMAKTTKASRNSN